MDQSKNHFLYDPKSKDLKLFENADKWSVAGHEAAEYLRNHVIGSLEADLPPILDLFEQGKRHESKGFFAMLRTIFPYLTWASKLFCPKGTEGDKAEKFLNAYASERYKDLGKQLYETYRHGLMHNHFPNVLLDSNPDRVIGWKITLDASKHLQPDSGETIAIDSGLQVTATWIAVSPRQLYQDISSALQKYATDLESDKFISEFCSGFRSK